MSPKRGERSARRPHGADGRRRSTRSEAKRESQIRGDGSRGRPPAPGGGPALRRLLEGIGTPEPAPFRADSFQIEALRRIEREDVLVTAPTGSGKTWIAREGIRRLLAEGRRAWYTSPLKALTNSKYHEFVAEFGRESVGILTGDRKENPDAPLIVGTTEIYRNQLFDALRGGREVRADLVVLDEAHYLADEERGHVWEEAIILSPPRVRLLLLSATVGNADELAQWIGEVRGGRCGVITRPGDRPVPLRAAFLYPNAALAPLFDHSSQLNAEIIQFIQNSAVRHPRFGGSEAHRRPQQKMNLPEMPPAMLLDTLGSSNLLPVIIFLPTRRRCDEAASEAASLKKNERPERREARRRIMRELATQHPEVRRHRHWDMVVRSGVGSHHAGHIPIWKLVIERLMSEGLLDAIFATATVAAGVDFPARTVVFTGVEVRTGHGWRSLSASELQQMTGRAGRRGRDRVGFIVVAPGTHQNPQRVAMLLKSPPDALASQFRATYSTLLNLLDAYGSFDHVRDIVERSFAHRETAEKIARLERETSRAAQLVTDKLAASGNSNLTIETARGFERLASARTRLLEEVPQTQGEVLLGWLDREVVPGRVVRIGRNGKRHLFVTDRRGGNLVGLREDGRRAAIALDRVGRVYDSTYSLSDADLAFDDLHANRMTALGEPRLAGERAPIEAATLLLNDLMDAVVLASPRGAEDKEAEDKEKATSVLWSVMEDIEALARTERQLNALRAEAWLPFEQRARVLERFNYLDIARQKVTAQGKWLADLRVDRPLLVGEALARGLFAELDLVRTAGLVAALTADAERDYGELPLDDALVTALARYEEIAYDVATEEWKNDLEPAPEINLSAASTAARWAEGEKWNDLVRDTRAEEGDLVRMLSRTGEALLQISHLRDAHPAAARAAAHAASIILREPVRTDEEA